MDRTLIAFNLPNWITVVLMAALGYLVLGLASQLVLSQLGSKSATKVANSAGG